MAHFGVFLPQLRMSFATIEAKARAAEEAGFHSVWFMDHLAAPAAPEVDTLEGWTVATAVAARTSTIHLGHLVLCDPFRHPALLAKMAATLDHMTDGRAELGIGAGWLESEHAAYGFPFPPTGKRMEMLAEQLELVRREWDDGALTLQGEHYSVRDLDALPKPLKRPRLLLGGRGGARSLALAARYADEYNVFHMSAEQCQEVRAGLDYACESIARDSATLPLSLMDPVNRTSTERAVERLRQLESAGVSRVMLQHLDHEDLDTVEWIGRHLAPTIG